MDVSSNIAEGIKLLGSSTVIPEECYSNLLETAIDVLTDKPNIANVAQLCNSKGDATKHAYASLLSLMVEAARRDLNDGALAVILLQDYAFTPARNDKLTKFYKQNKNKIQASLNNIGMHSPHIVQVTWTLDYCIKSASTLHLIMLMFAPKQLAGQVVFEENGKASSIEQVGSYLYLIQLHTESCMNSQDGSRIKFLCTQEELQDLVWKLKDAVKHVERISASC